MLWYTLKIVGVVPLICWANASSLLCNAPGGYFLLDRAPDGTSAVLEATDQPAVKNHGYVLESGHTLVIEPRG